VRTSKDRTLWQAIRIVESGRPFSTIIPDPPAPVGDFETIYWDQ
jgi:hypothetical protein